MKPLLCCIVRTVAVGSVWDRAAAWVLLNSAASSLCLPSLCLWLVAIAAVAWQPAQAFFALWAYWPCLIQLLLLLQNIMFDKTVCLYVCLYTKKHLSLVHASFFSGSFYCRSDYNLFQPDSQWGFEWHITRLGHWGSHPYNMESGPAFFYSKLSFKDHSFVKVKVYSNIS